MAHPRTGKGMALSESSPHVPWGMLRVCPRRSQHRALRNGDTRDGMGQQKEMGRGPQGRGREKDRDRVLRGLRGCDGTGMGTARRVGRGRVSPEP